MLKIVAKCKKQILATALLLAALGLTACTGHQVELNYNTVGPSMTTTNLPAVMIVEFQNATGQQSIGVDSSGEALEAASSPTAWVSEALADELVRLGVRASYSPYASATGYSITGSLNQFWIEETGTARYKVKIAIAVELPRDKTGASFRKSYNIEQSSLIMPTDASLSELVESTLRDLVVPVAQDLKDRLPQN